MFPIPCNQVWALPFDGAPEFMACDIDESDISIDVDEQGIWLAWDVEAVEQQGAAGIGLDEFKAGSEGDLKRLAYITLSTTSSPTNRSVHMIVILEVSRQCRV
ncbi:MAG: hypothetical protein DDT34_01980 [Firmicutes bacterium]|nr:hypothetical protein [Bacillota bacterium]